MKLPPLPSTTTSLHSAMSSADRGTEESPRSFRQLMRTLTNKHLSQKQSINRTRNDASPSFSCQTDRNESVESSTSKTSFSQSLKSCLSRDTVHVSGKPRHGCSEHRCHLSPLVNSAALSADSLASSPSPPPAPPSSASSIQQNKSPRLSTLYTAAAVKGGANTNNTSSYCTESLANTRALPEIPQPETQLHSRRLLRYRDHADVNTLFSQANFGDVRCQVASHVKEEIKGGTSYQYGIFDNENKIREGGCAMLDNYYSGTSQRKELLLKMKQQLQLNVDVNSLVPKRGLLQTKV